ncbi:uncharacterized protein LOC134277383 [Saccostrea cucullata]|uniref:uncharacterized protein LOC134277383 n=1 Tax=Saccostrea cuccullata TaxID=36930 RepID=UPI002ED2D30D
MDGYNFKYSFLLCLFYFSMNNAQRNLECSFPYGLDCCDGYYRNVSSNKCIACQIGYHGQNCSVKCVFPSFGMACDKECKECNESECHYDVGCSGEMDVKISTYVTFQRMQTTRLYRVLTTTGSKKGNINF